MLLRLKNSKYGCYIGTEFAGAFAYADDSTLLAPTKFALNQMLNIAQNVSKEYTV